MGMTEKETQDEYRELVFNLVVRPLVFIIGLLIVGTAIDKLITPGSGSASQIFVGLGGIAFIIEYYFYAKKRMMKDVEHWSKKES